MTHELVLLAIDPSSNCVVDTFSSAIDGKGDYCTELGVWLVLSM